MGEYALEGRGFGISGDLQSGRPFHTAGWPGPDPGVTFTFPSRELLPGQAVVVASNPEALRESFPQIADAILGPFAGRLANNGETLTFLDGAGRVLDEVSYEDEEPWPAAADGDGFSLVRMRSDGAEPTAWMASVESGGNPAGHSALADILVSITRTSREALQLNFQVEAGRSYQLMATRDLSSDAWEIIPELGGQPNFSGEDSGPGCAVCPAAFLQACHSLKFPSVSLRGRAPIASSAIELHNHPCGHCGVGCVVHDDEASGLTIPLVRVVQKGR